MRLERHELEVDGETDEGRVNVPAGEPAHGVLLVPGVGHGPFGDGFDVVAHNLVGDGHLVSRDESWTDVDDIEAKTVGELQTELEAGIEVLLEFGCESVSLVAKGFGGGLALSQAPAAVDRIGGCAPAVEVGADEADRRGPDDRIGEGEDLLLSLGDRGHVDVPVPILPGTADRGVERADCAAFLDRVDDGSLTEIPGETHSFNERRPAVVDQTRWYLDA